MHLKDKTSDRGQVACKCHIGHFVTVMYVKQHIDLHGNKWFKEAEFWFKIYMYTCKNSAY